MEDLKAAVVAALKIGAAWAGYMLGSITLSNVARVLTIVVTGLQIIKLLRDLRQPKVSP